MAASPAHTDFSLKLNDEEVLGLHILATLTGVAKDDADGFQQVAATTLRRGLRSRFDSAGLPWPPSPEGLERASGLAATTAAGDDDPPSSSYSSGAASWHAPAAAGLAIATVVVLVGGYALKWSWTGMSANNQLWDWMHLLLLPVALGLFPLWLSYSGYMSSRRLRALAGAAVACVVFVLIGYVAPLVWTGFRGQTLWDWLTLLLLPLALASVQAWPTSGRELRRRHVALAIALLAAWVVTLIGGYGAGWRWTGYAGNTLWDWVSLLLAPVAITFVVPRLADRLSGNVATRAAAAAERRARESALNEAKARI